MPATALIDYGADLACWTEPTDGNDSCVDAFQHSRLPGLTSGLFSRIVHLVGDKRLGVEAAWRFVRSGALVPRYNRRADTASTCRV